MQAVRLLAAAFLVAVALAAAGCGGTSKSAVTTTVTTTATTTNPTGTASVTTHGRFSYPAVLIDNFMRSCTRGGPAKEAYCACTLDKLSNTVSTQDFTRIGLSGGKVSPRVRLAIKQASAACADKL
jgi:O-acetyl-ADP-ribose deacetylase (regulator of RNase III)